MRRRRSHRRVHGRRGQPGHLHAETRAVARLITAMTRNVTRGTGIQDRVTQCETGHWTRTKQEIKFIGPRDAACTPLTYKMLYNITITYYLARATMLYNCFWLHGHSGSILIRGGKK